jgi:flagellar biosynthesis protein FlhG
VSGPGARGAGRQDSAARNLSPGTEASSSPRTGIASRTVISRQYDALPGAELEAIEVDCQGINGAYLRKVRVALDLDLFYIAAHTKIGRAMLGYIEDDCVDELPARVYLKGYLCHIARLLKLPESHTAAHYLQSLEGR